MSSQNYMDVFQFTSDKVSRILKQSMWTQCKNLSIIIWKDPHQTSGHSVWDIAGRLPREFDFIAVSVSPLRLRIDALNLVSVFKVPIASPLWLIKSEVALEVGAVGVEPLAADKLPVLKDADVLLTCLEENVCSLSFFLSIGPHARVDILIGVGHDTLAVSLSILPVAVILAHRFSLRVTILLSANTVLLVVNPGALVRDGRFLTVPLRKILVGSISVANLQLQQLGRVSRQLYLSAAYVLTPSTKSPSNMSPLGYIALAPLPVKCLDEVWATL